MTKTKERDEIVEHSLGFFEHGPEINKKFKDHYPCLCFIFGLLKLKQD
jgi:hypothetical protein